MPASSPAAARTNRRTLIDCSRLIEGRQRYGFSRNASRFQVAPRRRSSSPDSPSPRYAPSQASWRLISVRNRPGADVRFSVGVLWARIPGATAMTMLMANGSAAVVARYRGAVDRQWPSRHSPLACAAVPERPRPLPAPSDSSRADTDLPFRRGLTTRKFVVRAPSAAADKYSVVTSGCSPSRRVAADHVRRSWFGCRMGIGPSSRNGSGRGRCRMDPWFGLGSCCWRPSTSKTWTSGLGSGSVWTWSLGGGSGSVRKGRRASRIGIGRVGRAGLLPRWWPGSRRWPASRRRRGRWRCRGGVRRSWPPKRWPKGWR